MFSQNSIEGSLSDLLERERQILLTGDLGKLATLLPEKLRLQQLVAGETDSTGLVNLKAKILHNQSLLKATMQGIRAATQRLKIRRTTSLEMKTYDKSGTLKQISLSSPAELRRV